MQAFYSTLPRSISQQLTDPRAQAYQETHPSLWFREAFQADTSDIYICSAMAFGHFNHRIDSCAGLRACRCVTKQPAFFPLFVFMSFFCGQPLIFKQPVAVLHSLFRLVKETVLAFDIL